MADQNTPLVQDLAPLNGVKYAARDYPSIFDALLRRLKIEYSTVYNDFATTSQGIMLVELMAYAMEAVQWYIDRRASDCFLDTARTNSAIARLVKQIGYKMGAAGAASVDLTLTFPDGTDGPFLMPARWQYQGPDGLLYESYAEYSSPTALDAGATVTIAARQGETKTVSYTSDGSKNQQYRLASISDGRFLGNGTVEMWVDGSEWEENTFLEFEKTNQFEVGYNDDPPIVQCGDGIAGNVPEESSPVKIRFLVIDGASGNVKANTITTSVDSLTINGENVTFTVTNESAASGGSDLEDPEQARRLAPFSFAARGAAITKQDYEALSNSYTDPTYGTVSKSYAFNPRNPYDDAEFNRLVAVIASYMNHYLNGGDIFQTGMTELEGLINASATSMADDTNGIDSEIEKLESARAEIYSDVNSSKTACQTSADNGASVEGYCTTATSNCDLVTTMLDDLTADIDSGISDADLVSSIDEIKAQVALIRTGCATSRSLGGSIRTALTNTITDKLYNANQYVDESAVDPPDGNIPGIITSITAYNESLGTTVIDIQDQISVIVGSAEELQAAVVPILTTMQERIGELFNMDCTSNYVQVPILSIDTDGNYAAPSVGLMTGLQTYLDSIKEVTQQVEVTDGSIALVCAQLELVLDVNKDAYVESEIVSDIVATIVGLLKRRDFNQPLYLSDLYEMIKDVSEGIVWVFVGIVGPDSSPSVIDSDGNLVPAENKIITFGSLLIKDPSGKVLYSA